MGGRGGAGAKAAAKGAKAGGGGGLTGEAQSIAEAEARARALGVRSADFSGLPLDVANLYLEGLAALRRMGFPLPRKVETLAARQMGDEGFTAQFSGGTSTLSINRQSWVNASRAVAVRAQREAFASGHYSTAHPHATVYHEVGHYLHHLGAARHKYGGAAVFRPSQASSRYGSTSRNELVAEGFARIAGGGRLTREQWRAYKLFGGYRPRERRKGTR
jgi:hypothetical protein